MQETSWATNNSTDKPVCSSKTRQQKMLADLENRTDFVTDKNEKLIFFSYELNVFQYNYYVYNILTIFSKQLLMTM